MSMAGPPGGGRRINEDTRTLAMIFMAVLLAVFFLLVIRLEWDKRHGKTVPPLRPTRKNPLLTIR